MSPETWGRPPNGSWVATHAELEAQHFLGRSAGEGGCGKMAMAGGCSPGRAGCGSPPASYGRDRDRGAPSRSGREQLREAAPGARLASRGGDLVSRLRARSESAALVFPRAPPPHFQLLACGRPSLQPNGSVWSNAKTPVALELKTKNLELKKKEIKESSYLAWGSLCSRGPPLASSDRFLLRLGADDWVRTVSLGCCPWSLPLASLSLCPPPSPRCPPPGVAHQP